MLGECLDMFVCLFQSRNTQFVSFPPFWAHCYKDCVSIMATANCLATAQSLNQPWESQFDLQTLISELRQGRVKYQVVKRWWGGKGEHISTEERTLSPVSACPFTLDLPIFYPPSSPSFPPPSAGLFFFCHVKFPYLCQSFHHYVGIGAEGKNASSYYSRLTLFALIQPLFF